MPLDLPVERQFRHNPYSASGRVILLPRQPSADAELLVGPLTNDSAHAPTKPMAFAIPTTPTPPNTTTAPQSVCSCIMKETAPTVPSLDKNISASMSNSELCDIHELKFSVACAKEGNPKTPRFSIGRVFLDIVDGNTEIAKFGTRGRGKGVVTFTTTLRPMKRDRSPTKDDQSPKEDVLDITSNVSHPQLPLLRVVVQSLAVNRTLQIKGFRVKWQGLPTGDAVAPLALRIIPRETPIYVDSPTIMLEVNPVKKE